jgi:hypothetical protein
MNATFAAGLEEEEEEDGVLLCDRGPTGEESCQGRVCVGGGGRGGGGILTLNVGW